MFFKLIILGIVAVSVYRLFGGKVPILDKNPKANTDKETEGDTLVECANCGTYVTVKEAIIVGKKYYCSKECIPN